MTASHDFNMYVEVENYISVGTTHIQSTPVYVLKLLIK